MKLLDYVQARKEQIETHEDALEELRQLENLIRFGYFEDLSQEIASSSSNDIEEDSAGFENNLSKGFLNQ